MTGTATWNGTTMTFNGSTQAFSNLTFTFPYTSFSLFGVFSNTTAPAATAYMNAAYAGGGYPMIGTYDVNKFVTARGVVGNTGALSGQVSWAAQITGTTTSSDYGNGVATDSSGNVFVTGTCQTSATFYNKNGTSNGSINNPGCFLAKYSSTGDVVWTALIYALTAGQTGYGVATDSSGNVFVTGSYAAALTLYNSNGASSNTLPFTGAYDCFLAKYSSDGSSVLWAARITGTGSEFGYGVATDSSGNVFVTGMYTSALTLYNSGATSSKTLQFTGGQDCFLAKYSSDGTSVMWAAQITGTTTSGDAGKAVATDSSGNVFVTGYYGAALTLYNSGATSSKTLPFTGGADCFVAKYSSDGTSVMWAAQITGTGTSSDNGNAIATDSTGNVFVTGQYNAALTLYNFGATSTKTLPFTGGLDVFLAKYSSDGTSVMWAAQITGTGTSVDIGNGVATDSTGNVFVTGYYSAALTLYNFGATQSKALSITGGPACFLAKYSSDGTSVMWATRIASTGSDYGNAVATDSSGNVFVTGYYNAALTLYNTNGTTGATLPFTGGTDVFLAKYSPDGYVFNSASTNVVVDTTYTGTTLSPYVNGSNQTTLSATTVAATGFYVGGPSNYFNGSVSEVLVYNSTLTTIQRQSIEGYLASKWGVKSKLPTTHPFYVTPAFNRAFSPIDLPACALWLDASDNSTMNSTTTVTTWNDKSGLGNTMTGTATWTGSNMTFNGSTQAFSNTSFVFPYTNFSMFGVYSNTTAPAASAYMNVMYATGGYPMIGTYDVNKFVTARGVVGNTGALSGNVSANSNVLVDVTYTGTTLSPYINGSNQTTLTATTAAATGIYVGGPTNYFNGSISELLVYGSTLTAAQRQQVEGYLTQKWGLTSQVVTTHPYKTIPPSTLQPGQPSDVTYGNWISYWQPYLQRLAVVNPSVTINSRTTLTSNVYNYFSGAWAPTNGNIYFVGSNASYGCALMTIVPSNAQAYTQNLTPTFSGAGGIVYSPITGKMYCSPYGHPVGAVLTFSPSNTGALTTITTPAAAYFTDGCVGPDGNIYFSPTGGSNILVVNPSTSTASFILLASAYYGVGCVKGPNDLIYFIPYILNTCMILNPYTKQVTRISGFSNSGSGNGVLAPNGNIYYPTGSGFGVIITKTNTPSNIVTPALTSVNYCCLGPDGKIYAVGGGPGASPPITVLDTTTNVISSNSVTTTSNVGPLVMAANGNLYFGHASTGNASGGPCMITLSGVNQTPSSDYLSIWA